MNNFLGRGWEGHSPLPRSFPQCGWGYPLHTPHPPRRLRHLDSSHSKILDTPLDPVQYLCGLCGRKKAVQKYAAYIDLLLARLVLIKAVSVF